jgi:hypothetical protein
MTGVGGPAGGELLTAVEPENVTAGGVGFLVIAGLAVGTVFLLRSLNKQLKKVDFEEEPAADSESESAPKPAAEDESEEGPKSSPT